MATKKLADIRKKNVKDDASKDGPPKDDVVKDDKKGGKGKPHPAYIYGAFLKALDKHQKPLSQSVNYVVSAVVRDMRVMAKLRPAAERDLILGFIDRYEELYKSGIGGGGGDDQRGDILQGP